MTIMTRATFPKDLAPGVEDHLGKSRDKLTPVYPRIFQRKKTNRAWLEWVMTAGLGAAKIKPEGSPVEFDAMSQGWSVFIRVQTWSLGFGVTQEAIEDNLYMSPVETGSRELVQSFAHAKEITHASHLNFAFDSNYAGGDGQPLISLAHPSAAPGHASYRNRPLVMADFSEEGLEQAIIDISKMKNERGIPASRRAVSIVIPTDLMFEHVRVLRGQLQPYTADNTLSALNYKNILQEQPIEWLYLTDPKGWFILTDVNSDEGLVTLDRIPFKSKQWGDDNTGNWYVTGRERYGSGWLNPRAIYASSPNQA